MPQTRQNLHNFGRVFWKAQAIDPLQNGKALRKRAFLVHGAIKSIDTFEHDFHSQSQWVAPLHCVDYRRDYD